MNVKYYKTHKEYFIIAGEQSLVFVLSWREKSQVTAKTNMVNVSLVPMCKHSPFTVSWQSSCKCLECYWATLDTLLMGAAITWGSDETVLTPKLVLKKKS